LAKLERGSGLGRGKKAEKNGAGVQSFLSKLGLSKVTAMDAQRIAGQGRGKRAEKVGSGI